MRFGPVPVEAAEGAILAHSESLGQSRLRKGRVLAAEDVAALAAAGFDVSTVTPRSLGTEDVTDASLVVLDRVRACRPADVRELAGQLFSPDQRYEVSLGPR